MWKSFQINVISILFLTDIKLYTCLYHIQHVLKQSQIYFKIYISQKLWSEHLKTTFLQIFKYDTLFYKQGT